MSFETTLLLSVGLAFLSTAFFCQQKLSQSMELKTLLNRMQRAELLRAEQRLYALCVEQLEKTQSLLESGIGGTTAGVRALHHEIADIPFSVFESIPATRDTTKVVRGIHNLISDGVYSAISTGNKFAGNASRNGIKFASSPVKKGSSLANRLPPTEAKKTPPTDDSNNKG
jgi:hypothetical protein